MLRLILAEPADPRCQAAGRQRWGVGTRSWAESGSEGFEINATSRLRSSQASVAAGDSGPIPVHPLETAQRGGIKEGPAGTDQRSLERPPLINASSARRENSWLPSAPARSMLTAHLPLISSMAMGGPVCDTLPRWRPDPGDRGPGLPGPAGGCGFRCRWSPACSVSIPLLGCPPLPWPLRAPHSRRRRGWPSARDRPRPAPPGRHPAAPARGRRPAAGRCRPPGRARRPPARRAAPALIP